MMKSFNLRGLWAPPVWSRRLHQRGLQSSCWCRPSEWSSLLDLPVDLTPADCLALQAVPDCSLQFVCFAGVCVPRLPRRWGHLSQAHLERCQHRVAMPIPPPPPPPPGPPPPPTINVVSVHLDATIIILIIVSFLTLVWETDHTGVISGGLVSG